jgi:uncharacterized protein YdeI (YjbR/CyaY-like superfamily)
MIETDKFQKVEITSVAQLRDWLLINHTQAESIWLVTFKIHCDDKYVSRDEVLDELLCFGWIDGLRRKLDEDRTMQLISPRRHQVWAKTYKERAARLIEEGRMAPSGLAAIAESMRRHLWDVMAEVDALVIPQDLAEALLASPPASEKFDAFAPSYRRNVLRWLETAKTTPTRTKRINIITTRSSNGEKVPQY